jgi:hypothetical protein
MPDARAEGQDLLRVTQRQTEATGSPAAFDAAAAHFQACGYLKLSGFLAPSLLAAMLDALDRTAFYEREHHGIGTELCAASGAVSGALEFLLNDPVLFAAIGRLTGSGPIGCFEGRVYRLVPSAGHYDSWHSDVGQDRLVAMSLNLGRERFDGGALQIRRADSVDVLSQVENRTPGDAVIFRIDPGLRHRVGAVEGRVPRTAYAGWFRARPLYRELLNRRLSEP